MNSEADARSGLAHSWSRVPNRFVAPFAEWAIWFAIAFYAYVQTGRFDQEIYGYEFGAAGWPRTICIAIMISATAQFAFVVARILRESERSDLSREADSSGDTRHERKLAATLRRAAFFVCPFVYLYLCARLGFYLVTPFFVVLLLILLEVRSIGVILAVTAVIYCVALAIFTRFFFVALPAGRIEPFYDINNAIIAFARMGM